MHAARVLCCLVVVVLITWPSSAQFVGGSPGGREMTVEAARAAPVDTYVVVTGHIVAHLREEY